MLIPIHSTLDLVYSEDDQYWYFQDFDTDLTSIGYNSKASALGAYKADTIKWEEE